MGFHKIILSAIGTASIVTMGFNPWSFTVCMSINAVGTAAWT
jgi:TM2 domain-containing membrane protein YozV